MTRNKFYNNIKKNIQLADNNALGKIKGPQKTFELGKLRDTETEKKNT
jgi:hypothetical protein